MPMLYSGIPSFTMLDFLYNWNRNVKNYQKLHRVVTMMSFFGLREWKFANKNIDQLATLLKKQQQKQLLRQCSGISRGHGITDDSTKDISKKHTLTTKNANEEKCNRKLQSYLEFDMRTIDWNEYFVHYMPGIKKYYFKDPVGDNNKHYNRF